MRTDHLKNEFDELCEQMRSAPDGDKEKYYERIKKVTELREAQKNGPSPDTLVKCGLIFGMGVLGLIAEFKGGIISKCCLGLEKLFHI